MTEVQQKKMAERIKRRREALGHTQESFCEAIGLSSSSYTKIENAFQKPALDTLIKIAKHLDLPLDYIVFGTGEDEAEAVLGADFLNAMLKEADSEKLLYASRFLARLAKAAEKE